MDIEIEERFENFKKEAAVLSKASKMLANELIQVEESADKLKRFLKWMSDFCNKLQKESEELFGIAEDDYCIQQLELQNDPEYQSYRAQNNNDYQDNEKAEALFEKDTDDFIYRVLISDQKKREDNDDYAFLKALHADEKYNDMKDKVGEKLAKFYFVAKKKGQYKDDLKEILNISSTQTIYDRADKLAKKGYPEIYEFLNISKRK